MNSTPIEQKTIVGKYNLCESHDLSFLLKLYSVLQIYRKNISDAPDYDDTYF